MVPGPKIPSSLGHHPPHQLPNCIAHLLQILLSSRSSAAPFHACDYALTPLYFVICVILSMSLPPVSL